MIAPPLGHYWLSCARCPVHFPFYDWALPVLPLPFFRSALRFLALPCLAFPFPSLLLSQLHKPSNSDTTNHLLPTSIHHHFRDPPPAITSRRFYYTPTSASIYLHRQHSAILSIATSVLSPDIPSIFTSFSPTPHRLDLTSLPSKQPHHHYTK